MNLFYILLVLLIVTRLFGEFATRFNQAVLVGELLAGVALGLLVQTFQGFFPALSGLSDNEVFHAITDLAIYFLMLLAGLEMRPRDLYRASSRALWVAGGGMLAPLALGLALGFLMLPASPAQPAQAMFLAVSLAITAVPATVATLMELGLHESRVGRLIVSAAVFDDLASLFLLAVLTSLIGGAEVTLSSMVQLGGRILLFFPAVFVAARYLFPATGRLAVRLRVPQVEFSMLMMWALALSLLAEVLGMHFILGAYSAGLFFTRKTMNEEIHRNLYRTVETITFGFFAPIFFASIGLSMRPGAILRTPGFLLLLLATAFVGKLLGAGLAAHLTGLSRRESLAVGVAMNSRGAVELIVAGIALDAGLLSHPSPAPPIVSNMFSAIVLVAIVTTLVSPIVLRMLFSRDT